jgi:transglutaminase-like putative cysteine protease
VIKSVVRWVIVVMACVQTARVSAEQRERKFTFTYSAKVTDLPPCEAARIWLPIPQDTAEQQVQIVRRELPGEPRMAQEPKYGNAFLYLEATPDVTGSVPLKIVYHVHRFEVCDEAKDATSAEQLALFLKPDAKVPVDGKPLSLLTGLVLPSDQQEVGRRLYDLVDDRMEYRKDKPGWGTGDAVWACDSRFGNCTDFHSLFISLARSQHIPAKFEIGFGLPEEHGKGDVAGYHCWAKFKPAGHGWVPVDVSEANKHPAKRDYFFGHLCENRVAFTTGRDLTLSAEQKGPPLNFFVYPYVEVDGKPLSPDKVKKIFLYEDDAQK